MEPHALPPEVPLEHAELLAHVSWVRRLARALVHDDATAEDVEQQTWLAALSHPPHAGDPVRGWLRTVAQNVVRKWGRDDAARRRREEGAAPREALPGVDDAVARAELHARVVAIVLALDEPYRTTLIRRFFDELPPSVISQRDDVPVETVKTRLKRGLELVRGRIDMSALAPLLGIPAAGVTVMAVSTSKLAGVAALVVALAVIGTLVFKTRSSDGDGTKVAMRPAAAAANREQGKSASASAEVVRAPEEVAAPVDSPIGRVLLEGFVVDTAGSIVPDATIAWAAGGLGDEAKIRAWSAADRVETTAGQYAIEGLPSALVTFRVEATGCVPLDLTLDLAEQTGVQRNDFVVTRAIAIPVKVVTPEGKPFFSEMSSSGPASDFTFALSFLVSERPIPATLPPLTASYYWTSDAAGRGYLVNGPIGLPTHGPALPKDADGVVEIRRLPVNVALLFKNVVLASQSVTSPEGTLTFTVDPAKVAAQLGRITATCIDAGTGDPLTDASVQFGTDSGGGRRLKVDADGSFETGPIGPGWIKLDVSAKDHERFEGHVLVKPGETTDLGELELGAEIPLTGSVTGVDGKPATTYFGVLCLDRHVRGQPLFTHEFLGSGEGGKLQIPGLGRHRYMITSMPGEPSPGAALFVVDLTSGVAPAPLELRLKPATFVHVAPRMAPDRWLHAELATAAGDLVMAQTVADFVGLYVTLPDGGYVVSLFDGDQLLRAVPFDATGPRLLVEFEVDAAKPATISAVDPSAPRLGLRGVPTPTAAVAASRHATNEPGIVLSGTVKDRSGAPAEHGFVTARDAAGHKFGAATTANGSFALAGLPPGRFDVTATAVVCIEKTEAVEVAADAEPRRVDFVLDRTTHVKVTFTDLDGAPLEPALRRAASPVRIHQIGVVATLEAPQARLKPGTRGVARWQGGYEPQQPDYGTLDVTVPLPVFVSAVVDDRVVATQRLDVAVDELALAIDPRRLVPSDTSLQFRLVDAKSAEPIVTASVAVSALGSMAGGAPTTLPAAAGGVWKLDHLAPGRQTLTVSVPGCEFMTFVVDLAEGQVNDLGDLQVLRNVKLHGVAVDEAGRPSTEMLVVIFHGMNGEPQFDGIRYDVEPDADGRFEFAAATPLVRLQVLSRDFAVDPLIVDARLAPADGLRVVVRKGVAVTLRAKLAAGESRHIRLRREDGVLLREFTFDNAEPQQIRLVAGRYRAVVDQDGANAIEKKFEVADAPVEVDVGK